MYFFIKKLRKHPSQLILKPLKFKTTNFLRKMHRNFLLNTFKTLNESEKEKFSEIHFKDLGKVA